MDTTLDLQQFADTDYVIRGTAANGLVRGFAATTRRTAQEARSRHQTSPVVTAALGRLLTAGAMMGAMLKEPGELMTLSVRGAGPIGGLTVTVDAQGHVKGYANNNDVWLPLNSVGHLDVGGAVGAGTLTVVQEQPWGAEPYTTQLDLFSGEIGDDIAAYFAESEQVPTSVGVGVLVDTDLSVKQSGGFIVQLMPDCTEEVVCQLEENLKGLTSVTDMLESGMSPLDILQKVLAGLDFQPMSAAPVAFTCNCSRERTERILMAMGAADLQSLIDDGEPAELVCSFCGDKYTFTVDEMRDLLAQAQEGASQEG